MQYISDGGSWLKGNLHSHSTSSDGTQTPATLAAMYRARGYSFLALSEHELFTACELSTPDFVIIPAIERAVYIRGSRRVYHLNGFQGARRCLEAATQAPLTHGTAVPVPDWEGPETAQRVVDELVASGNLVMLNHPVWSMNTHDEAAALGGYFALEIYNHGCAVETNTGLATPYWDHLLRSGRRVWGIATDDNHNENRFREAPLEWDSFGGWVMVGAPALTSHDICDALLAGRFYSSSGPVIHQLAVEGDTVTVLCSPVERIYFLTGERRGYSRCSSEGGELTSASYRLTGDEHYVRVECVDGRGRTAWSNPVFLR